jgi:hypothetical protein
MFGMQTVVVTPVMFGLDTRRTSMASKEQDKRAEAVPPG